MKTPFEKEAQDTSEMAYYDCFCVTPVQPILKSPCKRNCIRAWERDACHSVGSSFASCGGCGKGTPKYIRLSSGIIRQDLG